MRPQVWHQPGLGIQDEEALSEHQRGASLNVGRVRILYPDGRVTFVFESEYPNGRKDKFYPIGPFQKDHCWSSPCWDTRSFTSYEEVLAVMHAYDKKEGMPGAILLGDLDEITD